MADALLARLQQRQAAGGPARPPQIEVSAPPALQPPPAQEMQQPANNQIQPIRANPHIVRPTSVVASSEFFGQAATDQLLGYHARSKAAATALGAMASRQGSVKIGFSVGAGLCAVLAAATASGAYCAPGADDCMITAARIATVASSMSATLIALQDRTKFAAHAVAWRQLSREFDRLAREISQALFVTPPADVSAGNYVKKVAAEYKALEARAPTIASQAMVAADQPVGQMNAQRFQLV